LLQRVLIVLQGPIAAYPRGDPRVQQISGKEDWAFSRYLLKTTPFGTSRTFRILTLGSTQFRPPAWLACVMCERR